MTSTDCIGYCKTARHDYSTFVWMWYIFKQVVCFFFYNAKYLVEHIDEWDKGQTYVNMRYIYNSCSHRNTWVHPPILRRVRATRSLVLGQYWIKSQVQYTCRETFSSYKARNERWKKSVSTDSHYCQLWKRRYTKWYRRCEPLQHDWFNNVCKFNQLVHNSIQLAAIHRSTNKKA